MGNWNNKKFGAYFIKCETFQKLKNSRFHYSLVWILCHWKLLWATQRIRKAFFGHSMFTKELCHELFERYCLKNVSVAHRQSFNKWLLNKGSVLVKQLTAVKHVKFSSVPDQAIITVWGFITKVDFWRRTNYAKLS